MDWLVLVAASGAYAAGRRRGGHHSAPTRNWLAGAGFALLAVALALDGLAAQLMTAHMVQHLLVVLVAPPLLVLGRAPELVVRGLPEALQRPVWRAAGALRRALRRATWLSGLGLAALVIAWWAWHIPALYDAAAAGGVVHAVEHATLALAGVAFWAPVVRPRRTPEWVPPLLLLGATIQGGLLAAVLAFAPRALYAAHAASAPRWGLSPLTDQQVAAAVGWVLGGVVLLFAAATTFVRWLEADDVGT